MQWQLIGQIDDVQHLQVMDIIYKSNYPDALHIKMKWSKNLCKERDPATQMVLASVDPTLCCYIAIASHIKTYFTSAATAPSTFLFGPGTKGTSSWAQRIVREMVKLPSFVKDSSKTGVLGTHGLQKGAVSYCARNNMQIEHVDARRRWSKGQRMVTTYNNIHLPVPDARVLSCLAGPMGPCKYVVKSEAVEKVSDDFLLSVVAPLTSCVLGDQIALILAKALLYAAVEGFLRVPEAIVERIWLGLERIGLCMAATKNPIGKNSHFCD